MFCNIKYFFILKNCFDINSILQKLNLNKFNSKKWFIKVKINNIYIFLLKIIYISYLFFIKFAI